MSTTVPSRLLMLMVPPELALHQVAHDRKPERVGRVHVEARR